GLYRGERYSLTEMREARRSVYDLGAFATVAVEPRVPEEGNEVDIVIAVAPAKRHRFGVGVGVQSGILRRSQYENVSVEQWDLHLSARYENRRVFGRLPRLTIEDRPRVVFSDPFPQVNEAPRFGNLIDIELRIPGAIEKRTTLVIGAAHDYGPDNFGGRFFRHDVSTRLLLERFFWRHRIFASVGFRTNVRRLPGERDPSTMPIPPPSGYDLFYLEQVLRLDTRDDPVRPHRGLFLQLAVHEAFPPSSWTYFRVLPDARVYVPLPRRITLAARFALGMYFIRSADENLDPISRAVGPRGLILQGGGPTSNRGYLPGNLGDSETGGARRWEASLELRFPITASFGGVLFADAGDVRRDPDLSDGRQDRFRWDHPQTSVGLGFRYFSFLGPIRLDFAWQVKSLTVFGEDERIRGGDDTEVSFGFFRFPGAWHLSIGESF
ncbi:MAG TPA: BamA/TamA family outer membrane protein, partial [Polyangiaceae bacterium LLY-WYZ-15_(1-7)]|nr:BamA/TamA family outer membrane protein [Polyangiaceae bacterium LLY-WYZ-15_(1-7)]